MIFGGSHRGKFYEYFVALIYALPKRKQKIYGGFLIGQIKALPRMRQSLGAAENFFRRLLYIYYPQFIAFEFVKSNKLKIVVSDCGSTVSNSEQNDCGSAVSNSEQSDYGSMILNSEQSDYVSAVLNAVECDRQAK